MPWWKWIDKRGFGRWLIIFLEDPVKGSLLSCQKCDDCGIQHLAFRCPESGCPKHTRNWACGGSKNGMCEVFPDRRCVWEKAYHRLVSVNQTDVMTNECIPPRMWELDHTSSWLNFHLKRDHQSKSSDLIKSCSSDRCRFDSATFNTWANFKTPPLRSGFYFKLYFLIISFSIQSKVLLFMQKHGAITLWFFWIPVWVEMTVRLI